MRHIKKFLILVSLTIFVIGSMFQVRADFGPKPTSEFNIVGLDEPYYFDLLTEYDAAPTLTETEIDDQLEYYYYREDHPAVLNGYRDADGFASYTLYSDYPHTISQNDNDSNIFYAGYFVPPTVFKIALVTESGTLIVSEVITKTAFAAHFIFDISDVDITTGANVYTNVGTIEETFQVPQMLIQVGIALFFTLVIELFILWLFQYRSKEAYKRVLIVNIITQSLLQIAMVLSYVFGWAIFGALFALIIGEFIIFILEIILYIRMLKEHSKKRATMYAITANLGSLILSYILLGLMVSLLG